MRFLRLSGKLSAQSWLVVGIAAILLMIGTAVALRTWYNHNLTPVSSTYSTRYFTVLPGNTLHQIAVGLENEGLIRSARAFETYVRSSALHDSLQAGTYSLSASMSVKEIVDKMSEGSVAKNLVTILPGKRLDQIRDAFAKQGYERAELDAAFKALTYRDHPALESLPAGASLEGYLYPESFQKEANTPAETLVRKSLDEMQKRLSPDIKAGFKAQGLSEYEGIILASIVLQESGDSDIQPIVAQVFLTRLERGMPLQADPTAFYASDIAGKPRSLSIDSPYNTYLHKGLPPGPISNVTRDAMLAVARPAKTDYLYFVAGDDGKVHFSHTKEQHEEATRKYCTKACHQ